MRRLPILSQTLGGMRTRSIVTATALALMAVMTSLEYRELGDSLQDLAGSAFYTALGGGADISTPEGFLSAYYFNFAPIIVIVVGIFASTSGVAGEEASGSLDLLLAQPLSRVSFLAQRAGGVALALTLTLLAGAPFLAWGVELGEMGVPAWRLLVATAGSILLVLLFVGVAYLACAVLRTRGEAGMAAGGVLVVAFFLQTLGSTSEAIEPLRIISPFHWAEGTPLLTGEYPWPRLAALLTGNLAVYMAAFWVFTRREIASGGGPAPAGPHPPPPGGTGRRQRRAGRCAAAAGPGALATGHGPAQRTDLGNAGPPCLPCGGRPRSGGCRALPGLPGDPR